MEVKKHEQTINIARSYPDFHCYIFHIGYINVVTINLAESRKQDAAKKDQAVLIVSLYSTLTKKGGSFTRQGQRENR